MVKKEIYILVFVLVNFINWSSYAQDYNKYCAYADYANTAYERDQIEMAISLMDTAIHKCPEQMDNAISWFNYALFNKQLAKKTRDLKLREKTLFAILKARELDTDSEFEDNINNVIKSLAIYYKNDAIKELNDTSSNYSGAIEKYKKYREIIVESNSNVNLIKEDISFYNVLAERNLIKYKNNEELYKNHLDSTILCYRRVIGLDSYNVDAYLDLAIVYFNEAIELVNQLDVDADLFELIAVDEKKAELALLSIPLLKRVLELEPKNTKSIYSLAACYKLISQGEEHVKYLEMLKEVDLEYYNDIYSTD